MIMANEIIHQYSHHSFENRSSTKEYEINLFVMGEILARN